MLTFPPLALSALAMLLRLVPAQHHAWRGECTRDTIDRYLRVASAIADVAEDDPIDGDVEATVTLLAVTAASESAMRADVIACRVSGDGGRVPAWSAFGLARPKSLVCGSLLEAARIARDMLRASLETCARKPVAERLAFFLSGDARCARGAPQSRYRWSRILMLTQTGHQSLAL